jgi:hypothetical protein
LISSALTASSIAGAATAPPTAAGEIDIQFFDGSGFPFSQDSLSESCLGFNAALVRSGNKRTKLLGK